MVTKPEKSCNNSLKDLNLLYIYFCMWNPREAYFLLYEVIKSFEGKP